MDRAFITFARGGRKYLAFPNEGGHCIVDECGNHYGTWQNVATFQKAQPEEYRIGSAKLSHRVLTVRECDGHESAVA